MLAAPDSFTFLTRVGWYAEVEEEERPESRSLSLSNVVRHPLTLAQTAHWESLLNSNIHLPDPLQTESHDSVFLCSCVTLLLN